MIQKFLWGILAVLLLAACADVKNIVDNDARVQEFLRIYPGAEYRETKITVSQAESMADLYAQECPDIEAPFIRATYKQYGATLIAYVRDYAVQCLFWKIEPGAAPRQGNPADAPEGAALVVNGQPISFSSLQAALAALPQEQQTIQVVDSIIDQLVSQELLRQEAAGVDVSDMEVDDAYEAAIMNAGMTRNAFESQLNVTPQEIKDQIRSQLKVQKLLEEKLQISSIVVDEGQLQDFYLANTGSFLVFEQATFQQIFIQGLDDEAVARAQDVLDALQDMDFCAAVTRYSDDRESRERCGVYTTRRGVIDPAIEQVVFSSPLNETQVIRGSAGIHLIRVLTRQPTQVLPYEQVQQQLTSIVRGRIAQLRLDAYLASLKADADIVSYLEFR